MNKNSNHLLLNYEIHFGFILKILSFILFYFSSVFATIHYPKNHPECGKDTIGSHLTQFYPILLQKSMNDQVVSKDLLLRFNCSPEVQDFYNNLSKKLILTEEEKTILSSLPERVWSIRWHWNSGKWFDLTYPYYLQYHKVLGSVSRRIVKEALIQAGFEKHVECPVIHYRLGDVPFCRQKVHHLNKYSFYLWALSKIKFQDELNKTVIIVSSNKHYSETHEQKASNKYLEYFIKFLNENGYNTLIQSASPLDDFATMVFAPALISGSSGFSFWAGLANENIFISSLIGHEYNHGFVAIKGCEWMYPYPPLLHKEVKDYFDVEAVVQQLNDI